MVESVMSNVVYRASLSALLSAGLVMSCTVETVPGDTEGASGGLDSVDAGDSGIPGGESNDAGVQSDSGASDSGASESGTDSNGDGGTDGETEGTSDTGVSGECVVTECQGKIYECGDCIDNDDDGLIDTADPNCWGPCDNNEAGWKGEIPGQNNAPCFMDCYFDADSGHGNDNCFWSHGCDPHDPQPGCYSQSAMIPGTGMSCAQAQQTQSEQCLDYCGPLTPNGCDCFGCCEIGDRTVYLGSEVDGQGSCSVEHADDPERCLECTIVEGCFNPCDAGDCQLCIGQTVLPDNCDEATCPSGIQSCNPVLNSTDCPAGMSCITGCCYPSPQ